jgi:hypothetical protein
MTVAELQAELARLNPDEEVWVTITGAFAPVGRLTAVPKAAYVVLRGAGKVPKTDRFTVDEEGILGHLSSLGLTNEAIAEVLDRPAESVKRKRKALGF